MRYKVLLTFKTSKVTFNLFFTVSFLHFTNRTDEKCMKAIFVDYFQKTSHEIPEVATCLAQRLNLDARVWFLTEDLESKGLLQHLQGPLPNFEAHKK